MKAAASTIRGIEEKDLLHISSFALASRYLQKDRDMIWLKAQEQTF